MLVSGVAAVTPSALLELDEFVQKKSLSIEQLIEIEAHEEADANIRGAVAARR